MRLRLREDAPGLLRVERTTPTPAWLRRLGILATINVVIGFAFIPAASAFSFCYIPFVCQAKAAIDFVSNPMGYLLQQLTNADIWFLQKMLDLIQATTTIDLTSGNFLAQYGMIFAASSLITVALWLIAVAKRAVRGVGLGTAIGEAAGFLLLQFVVNALTPGAIALLLTAVDDVTSIFTPYAVNNFKPFLENMLKVVASSPDQGLGQLMVVNLIMLLGALLMWVELLIRAAAIYTAVALGPIINAGLVDRDLWGRSKKWFGALFSVALTKPVLFALLGLGGSVLTSSGGSLSDSVSTTLVGALILLLAVFSSAMLYRWLPMFGDEMAQLHHDRKALQNTGPAAAIDGPAQHANRALGQYAQDAIVGGQGGGQKADAAKAAARKATGNKMAAVGTPVGFATMVAKGATTAMKNKATSSPGAQGTSSGGGTPSEQSGGTGGSPGAEGSDGTGGAPTTAQSNSSASPSVVGPGGGTSPQGNSASGTTGEAPASAQRPGQPTAPTGPVVSGNQPAQQQSNPLSAPKWPSSSTGTASGSGPSVLPSAQSPATGTASSTGPSALPPAQSPATGTASSTGPSVLPSAQPPATGADTQLQQNPSKDNT